MSTWPVLVLGIYLGYLVYLSTWSTVLDPNPDSYPPPFALNCFISVSVLRIPVEVPYFGVTMMELRSLIPPPPLWPKLLHICVNFTNSCWSPVFWCNNDGTSLSHPPSPIPPYIASYLSILWIPVEVPYFDVTMVELRSLIPPSLNPPYIASYLSILWIPVEVPYFDVIMVELRSLTPPPPLRPKLLHICQFYEFLLKSRILM